MKTENLMKQEISKKILEWDGKHIEPMSQLYQNYKEEQNFFPVLMDLFIENTEYQKAITWIIKHHLDQKKHLNEEELTQLYLQCEHVVDKEAQLHLLQILPKIHLPEKTIPHVEQFVRKTLPSSHKFVRAWAYQGLFELYRYMPELEEEVLFLCEKAMMEESASVKARVRKILARINKSK